MYSYAIDGRFLDSWLIFSLILCLFIIISQSSTGNGFWKQALDRSRKEGNATFWACSEPFGFFAYGLSHVRERGVHLHKCSSASFTWKCWICTWRQEQPHAGLVPVWEPGKFESYGRSEHGTMSVQDVFFFFFFFYGCAKAGHSTGTMVIWQRRKTVITIQIQL